MPLIRKQPMSRLRRETTVSGGTSYITQQLHKPATSSGTSNWTINTSTAGTKCSSHIMQSEKKLTNSAQKSNNATRKVSISIVGPMLHSVVDGVPMDPSDPSVKSPALSSSSSLHKHPSGNNSSVFLMLGITHSQTSSTASTCVV